MVSQILSSQIHKDVVVVTCDHVDEGSRVHPVQFHYPAGYPKDHAGSYLIPANDTRALMTAMLIFSNSLMALLLKQMEKSAIFADVTTNFIEGIKNFNILRIPEPEKFEAIRGRLLGQAIKWQSELKDLQSFEEALNHSGIFDVSRIENFKQIGTFPKMPEEDNKVVGSIEKDCMVDCGRFAMYHQHAEGSFKWLFSSEQRPIRDYELRTLGYERFDEPAPGDLALYGKQEEGGIRYKHFAIVKTRDLVISKLGIGDPSVCESHRDNVWFHYGDTILYLRREHRFAVVKAFQDMLSKVESEVKGGNGDHCAHVLSAKGVVMECAAIFDRMLTESEPRMLTYSLFGRCCIKPLREIFQRKAAALIAPLEVHPLSKSNMEVVGMLKTLAHEAGQEVPLNFEIMSQTSK